MAHFLPDSKVLGTVGHTKHFVHRSEHSHGGAEDIAEWLNAIVNLVNLVKARKARKAHQQERAEFFATHGYYKGD